MRAILLGMRCNNACVFCAQGDGDARAPAEVDPAGAIAAVEPGESVAFQGGEPTIFAGLAAWIRAADARGAARIVVQTNGRRLAYRAYARALGEASERLVLDVSLHGSTAPMHEYHTGVPGSFAQTVQGLRNARAEGIRAGVTTVVTRSSFRHLAEIVRVAHAAGALAIHFAPAEPSGRAATNRPRIVPEAEMVLPHLQRAVAEAQRLGLGVQVGDRATPSSAGELFAGIGAVEPLPAGKARVSLPVFGRGPGDGGREQE
jgi:MoaA/NifB/PqqE/SkfB family radical SAM enzyme